MLFNNESAVVPEVGTSAISEHELNLTGGLTHAYEIECAFNEMMESIGISELRYYNEAKGDLSKTEGGKVKIGEKIKAFLAMIVRKVEEIFNRAIATLGKLEVAAFLKVFGKKLDLKAEDFKSFKFKKKIAVSGSSIISDLHNATTENASGGIVGDSYGYKKSLVGKDCPDMKTFSAALKEKFYVKDSDIKEEDLKFADFTEAKKNLNDYKSWVSDLVSEKKKVVKSIKSCIKDDTAATGIEDAKDSLTVLTVYLSVGLGALVGLMRQSKAVCARALAAAKKGSKDKKEEPAAENKADAKKEAAVGPEPGKDRIQEMSELFAQVQIL